MKRPCEDSSSADVSRERLHYPGHMKASLIRCGSPMTTTPVIARKKRRGIIEKRRRDRINNSLMELRRLVPTAFEKQGSAKLEKAEILQMTVDHLKMLHATVGKGPLDFLSLGFRECVAEVSCYLSTVEALDSCDPLRCRLLSHLSSCASQRDAAARLQPRPLPLPHWATLLYGLSALPEVAAPPRLVEPLTPLSGSLFSFPFALPFLPPSSSLTPPSSSKPRPPWGMEVGGAL